MQIFDKTSVRAVENFFHVLIKIYFCRWAAAVIQKIQANDDSFRSGNSWL